MTIKGATSTFYNTSFTYIIIAFGTFN